MSGPGKAMANGVVRLYTDGSCLGNPGPGGYGVVLQFHGNGELIKESELSQGYQKTTNNRMEILAVIKGLETLTRPCRVEVHTDSQYVKKAFTDGWLANWKKNGWKTAAKKPVKNKDLWVRLDEMLAGHQVSWHWIKGHAGHPENERADDLAREAAQSGDLLPDSP